MVVVVIIAPPYARVDDIIYPALYSVRCRKIGTRDWRPGILLNAYRVKRFFYALSTATPKLWWAV